MFGIIYTLFMGCMYGIGSIKDDVDNKRCKEKYYNSQTGTYIDNRGCTRDYKTDEPRIVTNQWNKEKKRYEKIVLKNGTQIVKNVTEEDDKRKKINDNKIQINKDIELKKEVSNDWKIKYDKIKKREKLMKEFYRRYYCSFEEWKNKTGNSNYAAYYQWIEEARKEWEQYEL